MAESTLAHSPTLAASPPKQGEDPGDRLPAGTTAGDYVIDRFLGAGAMGEVYAGRQPVIGKRVAIKVLRRELAASPEAAERFVREARAVNQVDHASVVDVFAFGRLDDGRHYLVMDLIEGKSLRARLAEGPLEIPQALDILGVIADALDAAHARGVVHRDLKPDNVMLTADTPPKVVVLDFGIAKLVAPPNDGEGVKAGNGTLTGQGTWLGTPGYMAPEQWSADGAGPASDRYALGVTAFELLSGKLPFSASSLPGMMEQHFRAPVPALSLHTNRSGARPREVAGDVRSPFDAVLARAMAKQPEDRFATGRAMVDALRAAAGSPAKLATRRPWVPAAAAVGVLVLSVGAVLATRGGDPDAVTKTPETPAVAPPIGTQFDLTITTIPDGAEVKDGKQLIGGTPITLHLHPGDKLSIDVRKPGYRTEHRDLIATDHPDKLALQLEAITAFEGVWRLANGELRAFQRAGEHVDIFKLDAVTGPRVPYRSYALVPSPDGVEFANEEDVTDDRGGADARCHVPYHVRYHYAPKPDTLMIQRERVGVAVEQGNCIVMSRSPGEPVALSRVDGEHGTIRYTDAPAASPKAPPQKKKTGNTAKKGALAPPIKASSLSPVLKGANTAMSNTMDDALDSQGSKNAFSKANPPPIKPSQPQANAPADPGNSQIRATPKASPPPPDLEPQQQLPQQQQAPPQPAQQRTKK